MALPPPATARVWVPVVFQYQTPESLLMTAPLASVMPLLTKSEPLIVRLGLSALPSVTPLSVGLLIAVNAVPSLLMMVPPVMVPVTTPPATKARSSSLPLLFRVPSIDRLPPVLTMVLRLAAE